MEDIKHKPLFAIGQLVRHKKSSAIYRISALKDCEYETLNNNLIPFTDEGDWEIMSDNSWKPQAGDIFRKKGDEKPWLQLCSKADFPSLQWSFVQIMESGAAGGYVYESELHTDYELVERIMTLDESLELMLSPLTERIEKDKAEITPEFLEKNGFERNEHVYPYPYYEHDDGNTHIRIGYAFPSGSNKTKYKDNWLEVDGENIYVEHLPCKYVYQLKGFIEMFNLKLKIE